jgi:hypothetical protein
LTGYMGPSLLKRNIKKWWKKKWTDEIKNYTFWIFRRPSKRLYYTFWNLEGIVRNSGKWGTWKYIKKICARFYVWEILTMWYGYLKELGWHKQLKFWVHFPSLMVHMLVAIVFSQLLLTMWPNTYESTIGWKPLMTNLFFSFLGYCECGQKYTNRKQIWRR